MHQELQDWHVVAVSSPGKRKAAELTDVDDSENVDPINFAKRSKGSHGASKDFFKPSAFVLKAASTPAPTAAPLPELRSLTSPSKASARRTLQPRSPITKLNTGIAKSSPIHAAGRSPTRGKRSGGLLSNRRRTTGPYTRVDPPRFGSGSQAPFSLDAALKGTIAGYGSAKSTSIKDGSTTLYEPEMKASWFFDIHEDTPEQEMTNLLQHGTCVLDISSDEESERKASREQAEGRDKENVPPLDDVSQTSARRSPRQNPDDMIVEKERVALGEMNTADFFAEGCDESSVIIVPGDDDEESEAPVEVPVVAPVKDFKFNPELKAADESEPKIHEDIIEIHEDVDALMAKPEKRASKAAVLEPIEGTGESFELWESGSAKDETEPVSSWRTRTSQWKWNCNSSLHNVWA